MALKGPTRCFIKCSKKKLENRSDIYFMLDVVRFALGDPEKAFLLITQKAEHKAFIVFDYDNPDHSECPVLGFIMTGHIREVRDHESSYVSWSYVQSMPDVEAWESRKRDTSPENGMQLRTGKTACRLGTNLIIRAACSLIVILLLLLLNLWSRAQSCKHLRICLCIHRLLTSSGS
ncbi:hypothetical protein B0T25DRAFT_145416 [Lasiosphaeria hispida]|uniref:Uncharacterized protein n=1 Tax=Lasiosphaeria hispida TaxID=260671 RepID=A0AAJ0HM05_9PEZI|nr:hypothetical protein B0T25DRAFT_145416 [Lasiosphaeria hispida]